MFYCNDRVRCKCNHSVHLWQCDYHFELMQSISHPPQNVFVFDPPPTGAVDPLLPIISCYLVFINYKGMVEEEGG